MQGEQQATIPVVDDRTLIVEVVRERERSSMDEIMTSAMNTIRLGRLLIVDDEVELMLVLRDALSERGYEVAAFSKPRAALAALREGQFDVLLSDLMMPGMSGIQLIAEALKLDPHLIPIIMTGQGAVETAVEAMQAGAFDYVLKPFKISAILHVLSRAIDVRRLRTEVMQLRETVAIHDLCKAITHTIDFETLLHKVADAAMQQCEADEVSIVLPTRDGRELYVAVVRGRHEETILGQRMLISEGVAGWVAQHREPLILHGPVDDKRFRPRAPRTEIASSIVMPMTVGGKFVGVLNVNATNRTRPFTTGEVKALTIISSVASPMLESGWMFKQMREAEEKYRGIFENAVYGIFQITPEGRYLVANPALARMFGYESPVEFVANVNAYGYRPGMYAQRGHGEEFFRMLREHGLVQGFESTVFRRDGSVIWVSESARAVRDVDGTLRYFEGTTDDITARKQAERVLQESEENLRESNRKLEEALNGLQRAQSKIIETERLRALGEMASGIAHDFNNALGPILGFSELLLMRPQNLDDRAKTMRYLQMMNTGARDAAHVVSRLREFYRQRDEHEVFLPVKLNRLIEQAASLTQPRWKDQALASGRSINLETEFGDVPMIHGNESDLREMLTNLIFNAVDAMPEGGTITITTRVGDGEMGRQGDGAMGGRGETAPESDGVSPSHPVAPSPSHAVAPSPCPRVVLSVQDTGTGMTEETRRRCLEPFFSTKGEHGTGLGLPMVHGIVRRHDGTVDVDSEVGKGTTLTLRFPVLRKTGTKVIGADAPTVTRPLGILVVDDEPGMRETVSEYLVGDGHTVVTANDGREGLQKFNADRFDLVITDRAMPEMNGDQLAATIAKTAPGKPVIMLSGFGDFMNVAGELPEGVKLIISKPVTMGALRAAIAKAIPPSQ